MEQFLQGRTFSVPLHNKKSPAIFTIKQTKIRDKKGGAISNPAFALWKLNMNLFSNDYWMIIER